MIGRHVISTAVFGCSLTIPFLLAHCSAQEAGPSTVVLETTQEVGPPTVVLETTIGKIVLELDPEKAPITVSNFLKYVDSQHFDGTIFHRVIPDFMIQGGGFSEDLTEKTTNAPIQNEADNGLSNTRGTIAMARTNDPHSATAQFFINSVDNPRLNHRSKSPSGWGYTVFGKVTEGMEVVDTMSKVRTGRQGGMADVPIESIILERAYRQ